MQNIQKIKKKHVSRKLKSSWRKNVDITDVENFLEEQRQDERIGNIADKSDNDLFTIETKPGKKIATKQEKRKRLEKSVPKCYVQLENTSKVKEQLKTVRVQDRKHFKAKEELRKKTGIVPKRLVQASQQRGIEKKKKSVVKKLVTNFKKDIWAEEDDIPQNLKSEWYNNELVLHTLSNTGKPLVKLQKTKFDKPSYLDAIEKPHPGISYNPSLNDHQDLVQKVVEKEKKIVKREEYLDRVVTQKYTKMTKEEKEQLLFDEMAEGLPLNAEELQQPDSSEESESEYKALNPPVRNKKKDRKARRKQKEAIERDNKRNILKSELKKIKDINKVPQFEKAIEKVQEKQIVKKKNRDAREEQKKFEPRRVAYMQYEEPEIEYTDVNDLAGNLRNLKQEGNLMIDRFKSFQKRNLIAPKKYRDGILRAKQQLKRWAKYTQRSYKEDPKPPQVSK